VKQHNKNFKTPEVCPLFRAYHAVRHIVGFLNKGYTPAVCNDVQRYLRSYDK